MKRHRNALNRTFSAQSTHYFEFSLNTNWCIALCTATKILLHANIQVNVTILWCIYIHLWGKKLKPCFTSFTVIENYFYVSSQKRHPRITQLRILCSCFRTLIMMMQILFSFQGLWDGELGTFPRPLAQNLVLQHKSTITLNTTAMFNNQNLDDFKIIN